QRLQATILETPNGVVNAIQIHHEAILQRSFRQTHTVLEAGMIRWSGEQDSKLLSAQFHATSVRELRSGVKGGTTGRREAKPQFANRLLTVCSRVFASYGLARKRSIGIGARAMISGPAVPLIMMIFSSGCLRLQRTARSMPDIAPIA